MLYSLLGSCYLTDAVHSKTLNDSTLVLFYLAEEVLCILQIFYCISAGLHTGCVWVGVRARGHMRVGARVCVWGGGGMKTNRVHKSHHMMW